MREREDVEEVEKPKDGWLTRNVRPIVLLFLTAYISVLTIYDSIEENGFAVGEAWIDLFQTVMAAAIGGYFLGRTIDKTPMPWNRR
jgi:CDP-diglyceride synthetase